MRRLLGPVLLAPVLIAALAACGSEDDAAGDPAPTSTAPSSTAASPGDATTAPEIATDEPTTADPDPTDEPTKSPPLTPGTPDAPGTGGETGTTPFELVDILSETDGGGSPAESATPISTKAEADTFVTTFSEDLAADVERVLTRARDDGRTVYAQVVGTGCDTPTDVTVTEADGRVFITAQKVPGPEVQCFAPVTSVAVVAITG